MSTPIVVLGAAIVAAAAQLLLQKQAPVFAFLLSLAAAVILLVQIGSSVQDILLKFSLLASRTDGQAFSCLVRCTGILLLTDYAQTLCKETGADSLGWCAGLAGRCLTLAAAFPLLEEVCNKIWELAG